MGGFEASRIAQSCHSWWQLAGVDTLVGEEAANWLAKPVTASRAIEDGDPQIAIAEPVAPLVAPTRAAPAADPVAVAMPKLWEGFQTWLATDSGAPGSQWDRRRVLPTGEAGASLMVLTACPEVDEQSAGELFAGPTGQLLDAMLHAIGLTRAQCYCAALATTRPPGGRFDGETKSALMPLLWHHLALARPQRLLLLGNEITALVADTDVSSARGNSLQINQGGVKVSAAAILHPALLLARPALKAAAWDSLKIFNQGR